ncbi:coiled-coil domain-containing protein 57 isoform X8 [Phycodurus eques]|uniref:coiled-coil domain-containing protein 57 isoform X8 n=1 Tax=Phycodurus eques TaxID=693459 RepID=UPI002ACDE22A|nr:coiled-coil domain-containing protein 57 isoform X8 [Phycodurus eques]
MQAGGDPLDSGLGDLEALVANKEREWKELHARRIHVLEDSLKKAKEECSSLRHQYKKLKEDFQYNLSILDEREKELQRYDVITSRAVNAEQNRQEELSRLRIQVAVLEEKQAKDAEARQEEQRISENKAAQQRLQLDELRHSMTGTIQKQMEANERMKLEVQHRVHEMEVEFMRQKQELTATWDKEGRQQEHEFNLKLDEMHALLLSSDLKIKLLSKECEVQSQARMQATQALKASEELCKQLQTQLQRKADLKNEATAVKEVRIKELEDKLKWMENKLKKQKDDHIKKHDDMAQVLKEKDDQLESQCQAHKEQLKRAEKHNIKLQDEMEIQSAKAHLAQKDMEMVLEEKDDTVKRLRTEMTRGQTVLERHMSQASNEMVAKNTEFITLQNSNDKLRAELERRREEINRYKQDVSTGLKREVALEQARVQLELEWQRRCDAIKAKHYLDNEQLIQDLTLARDQAKADLSEKEKQLHDLTVLCPSVVSDKAVQSPVVQQVRDENFSLWQQQLNSTLMAGAASGNVQGVKRNIVLAHARLEQAAAYIARLSREKQQLIQMGNCLRGCINTPGLKEAIEQKRDSSTGEQGHQHDRLSALEQLQYRLTTQELQYAVRQMACTVAEHATSSDSIGPPIKGDSDLCSDGHKTTDESGAFKMSGKTPTINQLRNSLEVKKQPSSEDSQQSLKEIWEILDLGLSSSIYSEGESDLCRSRGTKSGTAGVMVTGTSAPIHSRSPANFQQKKNPSEAPSNPPKNCQHGAPGKIVKIRNYNAKD